MISPRQIVGLHLLFFMTVLSPSVVLSQKIKTSEMNAEVRDFLAKEVSAHFAGVESMNPPPYRVNGAITTGEFTWGSFMRVLAAQSDVAKNRQIAGRDTARPIAEMGLRESRAGGKAFSQLYAAQALSHFGMDLEKNAVWQSMNDAERVEWTRLLDAKRIYDPVRREVINLPENYLAVAARIAAYAYEFGLMRDRAFLDSLIERAAKQFADGALYADDDLPNGRFDRYSNEYARFCWKAAEVVGRKDILEKLKPSMKTQMRLWWDLVSERGYGYNWGRSQGLVSYLDTLEIVAFLAENPEFRPTSLPNLASLYYQAWRWIRAGYIDDRHTFDIFAYGRGNYSYISPKREFQQISTSFAKIIVAHRSFSEVLEGERIDEFGEKPTLDQVARFEFFSQEKDKHSGVWIIRQGNIRFALPITTGTKPAMSDYLAAPYGLTGFAAPVEEVYPSLTPFFDVDKGITYAASEGATEVVVGDDGKSLRAVWKKFGKIGAKSGSRFDIGLTSEIRWTVVGNKLIREEKLTADKDMTLTNWRFAYPSTADRVRTEMVAKKRFDTFTGDEGSVRVRSSADWAFNTEVQSTGDGRLSKGPLRPIPLHMVLTAATISLKAGKPASWRFEIEVIETK